VFQSCAADRDSGDGHHHARDQAGELLGRATQRQGVPGALDHAHPRKSVSLQEVGNYRYSRAGAASLFPCRRASRDGPTPAAGPSHGSWSGPTAKAQYVSDDVALVIWSQNEVGHFRVRRGQERVERHLGRAAHVCDRLKTGGISVGRRRQLTRRNYVTARTVPQGEIAPCFRVAGAWCGYDLRARSGQGECGDKTQTDR
jgi:hypothetical protein